MRFKKGDILKGLGLDMNCNHVEATAIFVGYVDPDYYYHFDCIIKSDGVTQYADSSDYVKKENP